MPLSGFIFVKNAVPSDGSLARLLLKDFLVDLYRQEVLEHFVELSSMDDRCQFLRVVVDIGYVELGI